jgi:hypothetical protein
VELTVTDTRGIATVASTTATVITTSQAVENAIAIVGRMVTSNTVSPGIGNALTARLTTAKRQIDRNNPAAAVDPLTGILNQLTDLVAEGNLTDAEAAQLRTLVMRIIDAIS